VMHCGNLFVLICLSCSVVQGFSSLFPLSLKERNICPILSCVSLGQSCDDTHLCNESSSRCSDGVCSPRKNTGETCDPLSNDCYEGSNCVDNVCTLTPSAGAGFSCISDEECEWINDYGQSEPSKCLEGLCYGRQLGEPCLFDGQCSGFTMCNQSTRTCAPLLPLGVRCNVAENYCSGPAFCFSSTSGTIGNCTPVFQQLVGTICDSFFICAEGLACGIPDYKCSVPKKASNISCTSSDICGSYEYCDCDYQKGSGFCRLFEETTPLGASAAYKDTFSCMYGSLCGNEICMIHKCRDVYCRALDALGYREEFTNVPPCALPYDSLQVKIACGF